MCHDSAAYICSSAFLVLLVIDERDHTKYLSYIDPTKISSGTPEWLE